MKPLLYRIETQTPDRAKAGLSPFVDWYTGEDENDVRNQAAYDAAGFGLSDATFSIRPATQAEIDA